MSTDRRFDCAGVAEVADNVAFHGLDRPVVTCGSSTPVCGLLFSTYTAAAVEYAGHTPAAPLATRRTFMCAVLEAD